LKPMTQYGPFSLQQLKQPFHFSEKCAGTQCIGLEIELFPVRGSKFAKSREPGDLCEVPPYEGSHGVLAFLKFLSTRFGWEQITEGSNIIALSRAGEQITLEPPGVVEYVSAPAQSLQKLSEQLYSTMSEMYQAANECRFQFLATGYHPLAAPEELPLVPKTRYQTMYEYMPKVGSRGREMMKLTCAVQVSVDFESEQDAIRKLRLINQLTPFLCALGANSAYKLGKPSGSETERIDIWNNTDPNRCGLLPFLFTKEASLKDYIDWAMDAPVYFLRRNGQLQPVLDRTFRELCQGSDTNTALSIEDWETHLNTMFPWARLKSFIEVRAFDGLSPDLALACAALVTTLLYHPQKLSACEEAFGSLGLETVERLLATAGKKGIADKEINRGCKTLLEIALKRKTASNDSWFQPELLRPLDERFRATFLPSQISLSDTIRENLTLVME